MSMVVEATYENGVLKPERPLPLREHEKVRITVDPEIGWARRTAGLMGWTGDAQTLERIAVDPEFGIPEAP